MKWFGKRKLVEKITLVFLAFSVLLFFVFYYLILSSVYNFQRNYEINAQKEQLEESSSHIFLIQSTVEKIADQIILDEDIHNLLNDQTKSIGIRLYNYRKIHDILGINAHLLDDIDEIFLYTSDGLTLSSREVRDDFDPNKNTWYTEALDNIEISGYSKVHSSNPVQGGYNTDVITYVSYFYDINNSAGKTGYLCINIDITGLMEVAEFDENVKDGSWLFDGNGNVIAGSSTAILDYDKLLNNSSSIYTSENGDIYIMASSLLDNWKMVYMLSKDSLLKRCIRATLPLAISIPIAMFILWLILLKLISYFIRPLGQLERAAKEVGGGSFDVSLDIHTGDEFESLANVFNKMVSDINKYHNESIAHEKKLQNMHIENLLLQINPHFIYNTLNSIVYMAKMKKTDAIVGFTNNFISLLQHTLVIDNSIYHKLENEITIVREYLYLQQIRYNNMFDYEIDIPEDLMQLYIPRMLLQPIVENSIFHGLAPMNKGGHLVICAEKKLEHLYIYIEDNGVGIDDNTLNEIRSSSLVRKENGHSIGIRNINDRLKEIYGDDASVKFESNIGAGTKVTVILPSGSRTFQQDNC